MKNAKLDNILYHCLDGELNKYKLTVYDVNELYDIHIGKVNTTINSNVKRILDLCGIKTVEQGIGWKIDIK